MRSYERHYCMICGDGFREGERVVELVHRTIPHERFLFHEECFMREIGDDPAFAEEFWEKFGFEWQYAEE